MKNNILIFLFILAACAGCQPELAINCPEEITYIKSLIDNKYNSDSVSIHVKRIKEEIYFPSLNCVIITIYNPTTKVIDFKKSLSDEEYVTEEYISWQLKEESMPLAIHFAENCNLSDEFNDIIIEFVKTDTDNKSIHRFITHYPEVLLKNRR